MGVSCKSDHFAAYQNKVCEAHIGCLVSFLYFFLTVHLNVVVLEEKC